MLPKDLNIFSLHGKDVFLNVKADNFCFDDGKVTFIFGKYDLSKEKGKRITDSLKIWLSIEEALYLGEILSTNKLISLEKLVQNGQKAFMPYFHSGGGIREGKVFARQLAISLVKNSHSKFYCTISAVEGPGVQSEKGLFTLDKTKKSERKNFKFALTYEESINMGLQLKRSIYIFDLMNITGSLEKTIINLKSK